MGFDGVKKVLIKIFLTEIRKIILKATLKKYRKKKSQRKVK